MAESSYERGFRHGTSGSTEADRTGGDPNSGGLGPFSRKYGPLPLWGWLALATVLAVVWYLYQKGNSQTATTSTPSGTNSNLIPQFVNQVSTNVTPPAAGTSPASGTPSNVPGDPDVTPSNNGAKFSWTAVPGSSKYQVKIFAVGPNDNTTGKLVKSETVSGTTASVSGLALDTTYKWQVIDTSTGGQTPLMDFETTGEKPVTGKPKTKPKPPPKEKED